MKSNVAVTVVLALVLGGCGSSPPTRFYSLEPTPVQARAALPTAVPVKVDAVHIPGVLDRRTIVRGQDHYQLTLSSQYRWGAELGEMTQRVLTQDLRERLPVGMTIAPEEPTPANTRGIVVDILAFEPDADGSVTLDAQWVLLQGSPAAPALRRSVRLNAPYDGSAAGQVAAMSLLVGRLADDIAQGLKSVSGS